MYLWMGDELTARKVIPWHLSVGMMRDIEWFRVGKFDGGTSYGTYEGTYVLLSDLNLLNLGRSDHRKLIVKCTDLSDNDLNPDVQYSGYDTNTFVHRAIWRSDLLKEFDGTVFVDRWVDLGLKELLGDAPEEVVIFTDRVGFRISLVKVERITNEDENCDEPVQVFSFDED